MITTDSRAITLNYVDAEELSKYLKIKNQIERIINSQLVFEVFLIWKNFHNA